MYYSEKYVAGVDVNMGCPKEFSIKVSDTYLFKDVCHCAFQKSGFMTVSVGWLVVCFED